MKYDPTAQRGTSDIELLMQPFVYDSAHDYEPDWEMLDIIAETLPELSPLDQQIIHGIFYLRLTYEDLASFIGIKAKSHAWRKTQQAMNKLKKKLEANPRFIRLLKGENMTTCKTWEEGAHVALTELATYAAEVAHDDNIFAPISEALAEAVRNEFDEQMALKLIERAGAAALHVLCADAPFSMDDMHTLLCKKQHDYGHGNILSFGMIGVAVRLCDKIARMDNLKARGLKPENETLTDTFMDILGYAAIAIMLFDGSFKLELSQHD